MMKYFAIFSLVLAVTSASLIIPRHRREPAPPHNPIHEATSILTYIESIYGTKNELAYNQVLHKNFAFSPCKGADLSKQFTVKLLMSGGARKIEGMKFVLEAAMYQDKMLYFVFRVDGLLLEWKARLIATPSADNETGYTILSGKELCSE